MKCIRIKPGRCFKYKKELRDWYEVVLDYVPQGYKKKPYISVPINKLHLIMVKLERTFY